MKKNTLLLCMLLSTLFTMVNAQNEKKIFKYIEEGNIEDAALELKKTDYSKGYKRKKLLLIQLGNILILGNENYQSYEPVNACNLFKSLSISNLESIELNDFLADYSLSLNTISDLLYTNILNKAKKINTESSYDDALNICKPCKYEVEIKNLKVKAAYNACINKGTVEGYKYFIEKYSDTAYISDVTKLLNKKIFEEAKTNLTIVSMNNYISNYPNSIYIKSAIDIRDSLALPKNITDYNSLLKYTKEYPNSKFTPKIINVELPNKLYDEALTINSVESLNKFITEYPSDYRANVIKDKLETKYYNLLIKNFSIKDFALFKSRFPGSVYINELNDLRDKLTINSDLSLNQRLNWVWAKGATSTIGKRNHNIFEQRPAGIITDSQENVYVIGNFIGSTISFDNVVLLNDMDNGAYNIFFAKYDPKGKILWAKIIDKRHVGPIAIDKNDDIYFSYEDTLGVEFISKYNSNGEVIWEKSTKMGFGSIAVNSTNYIYSIGSNFESSGSIIVKYDSMGNILWSKEIELIDNNGKANGLLTAKIVTDNMDNIYISGCFNSTKLKFGNNLLYNVGKNYYSNVSTNGFLMKCDSSGNLIWAKNLGASDRYNLTTFNDLVTNNEGDIYVVGACNGNLRVGNFSIDKGAFIIKYNENGQYQWIRGSSGCIDNNLMDIFFRNVAINRSGNIYISGYSNCQTVKFGKFKEFTKYGNLNFIVKYSPNGDVLCTKSFEHLLGSSNKEWSECADITTDNGGNLYATGVYRGGGMRFGSSVLTYHQPQKPYFLELNKLFITKLNIEKN